MSDSERGYLRIGGPRSARHRISYINAHAGDGVYSTHLIVKAGTKEITLVLDKEEMDSFFATFLGKFTMNDLNNPDSRTIKYLKMYAAAAGYKLVKD